MRDPLFTLPSDPGNGFLPSANEVYEGYVLHLSVGHSVHRGVSRPMPRGWGSAQAQAQGGSRPRQGGVYPSMH